ncbi:MAG: response regulator, partial [bacterium]|nr:response regulator [bacterium]
VVAIDPAALNLNKLPPPVIIEKVLVDNKPIPDGQNNGLEPGKENFEFHYTATSLLVPRRVKFNYRLEGFDDGWRDAGTRRTAYYNSIPPGDYRFRVIACNNDGVWNETGASVSFYLKPFFHQTPWFYFLCALVVGLIGFMGYRYRIRQLKSRGKKLAALVESRTRDLNERNIELENTKELIEAKNQQLEEQSGKLKEMDHVKSRFFANISHEFRTPLTLIMGPAEQMIATPAENEKERKRKLTLILRNAQRLLRLINQLLELSKLDSGKMKLRAVKTDIVSFVKGITASFQLLAHHTELDLFFHFEYEHEQNNETETGDIVLYIDPQKMEIVFTNLLANAVKFTPPGGKIEVTVKENPPSGENFPSGSVEISVSDTGPGIPKGQLAHIFDRFYQSDSTFEHHRKGSGIGLALTKELVELHHGTIEAESYEGKGSQFTLRFPMGSAHLSPDPDANKKTPVDISVDIPVYEYEIPMEMEEIVPETRLELEAEVGVSNKEIILVVEDSADLRDYIRGALETGYEVVEAGDGSEGIRKARDIIPDLVISDIMMPETDGYELCRQLKSDIDTSHIPIILLTAKASEENILKGLETGADDYVTKPFSTKILMARIKNLIDIRGQLQTNIDRGMSLQPVKTSISKMDQTFLNDLHNVIDRNLSNWEFNVEELRKELRMGRSTFFKKVRALSGLTPNQFVQSYRLKRGAELLKQNFGTVQDISFEVGFSSPSYFSKCFKERFHQQPSEYQAANQQ